MDNLDEIEKDLSKVIDVIPETHLKSELERKELYEKLYLSEIVEIENPKFESNNLILSPVGSGKSHLIENKLIPKSCSGEILYLTSNTALKDSICPKENEIREELAKSGKSVKFYTSGNTKRYGSREYNVHVMTYHEFASRLEVASQRREFLDKISLIFCDEIHSLPTYESYGGNANLVLARAWLFDKQPGKQIFYFTATKQNLDILEKNKPGTLDYVKTFDYLNHPKIRKYMVNSTFKIYHVEQIRPYLAAKIESYKYYGYKVFAFTPKIKEQKKIEEIAISEGFTPITLWSTNSELEMSLEQLRVRTHILRSGNIPEPYNMLIVNGAMQEGWNLLDDKMRLAILDTTNVTEHIQALGRIRSDVDILLCKTKEELLNQSLEIPIECLNIPLTFEEKTALYIRMNIIGENGLVLKWPSLRSKLEKNGYIFEDKTLVIDGKRQRTTTITIA